MAGKSSGRQDLREAAVLGAVLMAYSNGLAIWARGRGDYPEALFRRLNPAFVLIMLAYAARRPGGLAAVGLRRQGLWRSLLRGAGLGLALSGPPLFFFYRPLLLDTPLEYGPIARLTRRELLMDVLVRVPTGIALLEELAFRGLLYAALRRHLPAAWAIAGSSAAFAGWHLAVTATSAAQTNLSEAARLPRFLSPYVQPIAVAGGMLTTGLAGVAFGLLRERTGNLAGPILAHWIVDGLMIAALWVRRPQGPRASNRSS
jgi:uncharacterized protein